MFAVVLGTALAAEDSAAKRLADLFSSTLPRRNDVNDTKKALTSIQEAVEMVNK